MTFLTSCMFRRKLLFLNVCGETKIPLHIYSALPRLPQAQLTCVSLTMRIYSQQPRDDTWLHIPRLILILLPLVRMSSLSPVLETYLHVHLLVFRARKPHSSMKNFPNKPPTPPSPSPKLNTLFLSVLTTLKHSLLKVLLH